ISSRRRPSTSNCLRRCFSSVRSTATPRISFQSHTKGGKATSSRSLTRLGGAVVRSERLPRTEQELHVVRFLRLVDARRDLDERERWEEAHEVVHHAEADADTDCE